VMFATPPTSWRLHKSRLPGMAALEFLAMVPIAVPGLVLGMALIIQYVAFPLPFYGTVWVLLIAYTTKYLPYGMRNLTAATRQIRGELEEGASTSRRTWLQTLRPGL